MGIEYKHFIIPANASFVPQKDVLLKVDEVMYKWKLKTGGPAVYNLSQGENKIVRQPLPDVNFEGGTALEYPGVEGLPVSQIMGESYFYDEISNAERSLSSITFIAGLDYRVHPGNEGLTITVTKAPSENGIPLEPYCAYDEFLHYGLHAEAYSCSQTTAPPAVDIWTAEQAGGTADSDFAGFWRTAFIIDCGKDLPNIRDGNYKIPDREFIRDLEKALGSRLTEIGEIY